MSFWISGTPVPKGRPRFRVAGKRVMTYTPQKTREWEEEITTQAWVIRNQWKKSGAYLADEFPLSGRIALTATFYLPKAKSIPKSEKHRLKKPDVDNLGKALLDGLENSEMFEDDKVITDLTLAKRYAGDKGPGVAVEMVAWV